MLRALDAARLEQRQHLHGLSKPHVVGETSTELERAKKVKPAESFALILAEGSVECLGRIGGGDVVERSDLTARSLERCVDIRFRNGREQCVEQRRLRASEAKLAPLERSACGERRETSEPLRR